MTGGDPVGRPYALGHMGLLGGPWGRGTASPYPAAPRAAHHPEAMPRDLFVPAVNERVGMNDRGRPGGSPLHIGTHGAFGWTVGARHASPYPAAPRAAHHPEALPRELFVPAVNERVGMNDRGRPGGSPLRWDTWGFWPERVGARHCLALIRRRPAPPTAPRLCLAICLSQP